jgi:hypothetical protein
MSGMNKYIFIFIYQNIIKFIQLCQGVWYTPFVRTFPRKSPENHGKSRKKKQYPVTTRD